MAYNRLNYLKRVRDMQQFARALYEPGRQDRNWMWVWRNHVNPRYHIGYVRFMRILKIDSEREIAEMEGGEWLAKEPTLFDDFNNF